MLSRPHPSLAAKLSLQLGVLASLGIFAAFAQHTYVLVVLGPGQETDALFAGMAFPQLILAVASASLIHVLVPMLAGEDPDRQRRDGWAFFLAITTAFLLLAGALAIAAPWWVPVVFPGFTEAGVDLTVTLVRIQMIGMVFNAQSASLVAGHHARGRFLWPALTPVVGGVVGLAVLVVALPRYGIMAAAWASVLRVALHSVLLVRILGPYPGWPLHSQALGEAWRRMRPLVLGSAYYKSDIVFDRLLASLTPAGGLSLLFLGTRLYGFASEILNKAISVPMVPRLAVHHKQGEEEAFRGNYRRRLAAVLAITGGGYALLVLLGRPLLRLVVGYGGVGADDITTLWVLLIALVGVLVGGSLGQILSTAFYARGDTRTPTRVGVVGFTIGIGLKIGGLRMFGLPGIALGTTVYYLLNAAALYLLLERDVRRVASA